MLPFYKGVFAICFAVCNLSNQACAFVNGNSVVVKNRFFADRSRTLSSPIFSTEPANSVKPINGEKPVANYVNGASSHEASFDDAAISVSLLNRFRQASNIASFLCVLDCTLLPLVTVGLPLLGILNLGAGQLQFIDKLGHSLALYFVLPVGSLTTVVNYISHKKKPIAAMAFLGLTMVGLANSHFHIHHWPMLGPISLGWIGRVLHEIQGCGTSPWHRIVNISGCAFLLGSNYWSQQQDGCAADAIAGSSSDCCGHDHDHDH